MKQLLKQYFTTFFPIKTMFTHCLTVFYDTKDIRRGKEHCRTEQQQKDSITSYQPDPFPPSFSRKKECD